jgi:hypothetical protein
MVSGIYYGMWAQHMFQVKYVWSNTCGGAEREDVDWWSRSETLEQSGADRNNGNKDRKRCDIIALIQACSSSTVPLFTDPASPCLRISLSWYLLKYESQFSQFEAQSSLMHDKMIEPIQALGVFHLLGHSVHPQTLLTSQ